MEMNDAKYYFICYKWTRDGMQGWEIANTVTSLHPMELLKKCMTNSNDIYRITFFAEISKEHFDLLDGEL